MLKRIFFFKKGDIKADWRVVLLYTDGGVKLINSNIIKH